MYEFASVDREKNKKNLIEAYKYIGYYYVKQNDKANAKIYFEQVTSLDPTDQEAVSNLTILNKNCVKDIREFRISSLNLFG
ncbi:MAG: hypothetical protein IPH96_04335, partial [Saprospiraceae bacterium]|nr:hypothetical protein [Saprospiraceae bacterium]